MHESLRPEMEVELISSAAYGKCHAEVMGWNPGQVELTALGQSA